jgi:hypothetical protein
VEQWEEGGMETTLLKKKSIAYSVVNEENGYSVPDPIKTMINVNKEPSDTYKKIPQKGNLGRNHRETHGR